MQGDSIMAALQMIWRCTRKFYESSPHYAVTIVQAALLCPTLFFLYCDLEHVMYYDTVGCSAVYGMTIAVLIITVILLICHFKNLTLTPKTRLLFSASSAALWSLSIIVMFATSSYRISGFSAFSCMISIFLIEAFLMESYLSYKEIQQQKELEPEDKMEIKSDFLKLPALEGVQVTEKSIETPDN